MAEEEGSISSRSTIGPGRTGFAHGTILDCGHRAKQEVSYAAAPMFGDLVGRWVAAKQGRSFKCLVLDLDNTVWGGVVGDDGMEGIELGQGSPLGEAYVAFPGLRARTEPARGHPGCMLQER